MRAQRDSGLRLTTSEDRARIREIVEEHVTPLSDADLDVLGYDRWLVALESGVAAHHAGMVPPFKEAVEQCFVEGLVKVVFATETLALGINMPARSVVIEKLSKFNGDTHELLTPLTFTQLTGRAGRRGMDEIGSALVLWSPFVSFGEVAGLAASRSFPLTSAFKPTYNMAANLIRRMSRTEAMAILNLSLAQYQADREVVALEQRLRRRRNDLERAIEAGLCARGDVHEYDALRRAGGGPPPSAGEISDALSRLKPGGVIASPPGDLPSSSLTVAFRRDRSIRLRAVDGDGNRLVLGTGGLQMAADTSGRDPAAGAVHPQRRRIRRGSGAATGSRIRASKPRRSPRRRRASGRLMSGPFRAFDCPEPPAPSRTDGEADGGSPLGAPGAHLQTVQRSARRVV